MTHSGKRTLAIVILAVCLVAAVGYAIFLFTATDPAANLQKAKVAEAKEPASTTSAEGDQVIPFTTADAEAVVEVSFTGSSAAGEQPGFFQEVGGEAVIGADDKLKSLRGTVELASVLTNSDRLTNNLKNESGFFDVAHHPQATFIATSILPAASTDGGTHQVEGNLTLHGQTKSISFPATITVTPEAVKLVSEFSVNRQDFGINYEGGTLFPEIRDLVRINLNLSIPRPAAQTPATGPARP